MEFWKRSNLWTKASPGTEFDLGGIVSELHNLEKICFETYDLWMDMERSYGPPSGYIKDFTFSYEGLEVDLNAPFDSLQNAINEVHAVINGELKHLKFMLVG